MPAYKIAFVFVGSMVGAGFASGKEAWQFFGVFNLKGIAGVGLAIAMYCFLGYISIAIAGKLKTGDISKIMCPIENSFIQGFVGVAMCAFLLLAYVAMLAAGGSLLWEQFGLPHAIGSLIYMLLAVLTALGGFERLASRIGKVVPLLVGGTLIIALYIIFFDSSMPEEVYNGQASVFASHWAFAAVSYVGYNMTAAVPVLGQCALRTKDSKIAIRGTLLGGLLLGLFSLTLFFAMLTNPFLADTSDLPMLSFTELISPMLASAYAFFLLIAVFGASSTCFFGFTTKLGAVKYRTVVIWVVGIVGYLLSLYGFSNFVANVYPIAGYISIGFFAMEIWNFFRLRKKSEPFA